MPLQPQKISQAKEKEFLKRDTVGSKLWQIQNAVLTVNEVSPPLNIGSASNKSNQSSSVYLLRGKNNHISRNQANKSFLARQHAVFDFFRLAFLKDFYKPKKAIC